MLNETNGWSYTWNDLDPLYYWSVAEVCPEDYDVTYHRIEKDESVICTVINKYNPEEETPENTVPEETKPEETIPSKPKPDETEKLPQTGQLTWPIPWMVISGMMLFIIGWLLSKDSGKGRHEK